MPVRYPAHRQSFRVYDSALRGADPTFDAGFQLVVAAKQDPDLVEHALAHLRYVHTDVGIDWIDVVEMVGARGRPAYGVAHVVRGCDGYRAALGAIVAEALKAGRDGMILVQLVSQEDREAYTLERLDADVAALFDLNRVDLVFTSTLSPRESYAVVVAFDRSQISEEMF